MRAAAIWLAIGLVFLLAPGDFNGDGLLKSVAFTLFVVLALTPPVVYYSILRSLPERVEVIPVSVVDVPSELDRVCRQYEQMGFSRVLTPLRLHLGEGLLIVPMLNEEGSLATIRKLAGRRRPAIVHQITSLFGAAESSLTTSMEVGDGVLPAADGVVRQILDDASPEELALFHREAIEELGRHGIEPVGVTPAAVPCLLQHSIAQSRQTLLDAPVRNTLLAIGRTVTRSNPHLGMLAEQEGLEALCESLRGGGDIRRPAAAIARRPLVKQP